jgi:hypothetical protein
LILANEWCELGCEESELDLYLNECRNACENVITKPLNKMQEYLNCMNKKCLQNGEGPNDMHLDEMWLKCSLNCQREEFLSAHEATEKPIFHTQYLSEKQYENFKLIRDFKDKNLKKSVV